MKTLDALTYSLSEPLNGAKTATIDINVGDGNLTIDSLTGGEPLLAAGTLQYLQNQGVPSRSVSMDDGQARLTLHAAEAERSWFRLPWATCMGATDWLVHLNPDVQSDITAHSNGGNVKIDLDGMAVTRIMVDTGGGNMDVVLPDIAANLVVSARSGGGNVTVEVGSGSTGSNTLDANSGAGNVAVRVPGDIVARIHASSGLGKVIIDPRFGQVDRSMYQSPDYDSAPNRFNITAHSGAGNVIVDTK